jgi:hypothetical protein
MSLSASRNAAFLSESATEPEQKTIGIFLINGPNQSAEFDHLDLRIKFIQHQ